jgi:DinB superfamily
MEDLPEPWLRASITHVHPLTAPVLYTFQQAREDLAKYTGPLSTEQLWATPYGLGSAGFHILHIAGSTDRLMTYLQDRELSPQQIAVLEAERSPVPVGRDALLAELDRVFAQAETVVRAIDPASLADPRTVGRKHLPTTVIGLLTHIAEHTQRHVGQAISAAKLAIRS